MSRLLIKLLVVIVLFEAFLRVFVKRDDLWYHSLDHVQNLRRVDASYIFVGSSRVSASIIPFVFDEYMQNDGLRQIVLNMGTGSSSLAEHYYGIKGLIARFPNVLQGMVVFVEAPETLPEMQLWDEDWVLNERADLLAKNIGFADLWHYWARPNDSYEIKFAVLLEKVSALYKAKGSGISVFKTLEKSLVNRGVLPGQPKGSVLGFGGIPINIEEMKKTRAIRLSEAEKNLSNQKIAERYDNDRYVLYSLNKLIQDNGGRLVLFDLPLSRLQQLGFTTDTAQQNISYVTSCLASWNIAYIHPHIETTDDDFPDLIHLSGYRAAEFTASVADAYKRLCVTERQNIGIRYPAAAPATPRQN